MNILPEHVLEYIEKEASLYSAKALQEASFLLSDQYKKKVFSLSSKATFVAYALARMPATFAVNYAVIQELKKIDQLYAPKTVLDIGAGTLSATLAITQEFQDINRIFCLEKARSFIDFATPYMPSCAEWIHGDIENSELLLPNVDLIWLSYSLGEIVQNQRKLLFERLWNKADVFVFIEPGTPYGYQNILEARSFFLGKSAHIIAPCPHEKKCPLQDINDWCHFSKRLQRTKLHKYLKDATLGYEDEKFSYIIISKQNKRIEDFDRIIARPIAHRGHIRFRVCSHTGCSEDKVISKRCEKYKEAKKSTWGDLFQCMEQQ